MPATAITSSTPVTSHSVVRDAEAVAAGGGTPGPAAVVESGFAAFIRGEDSSSPPCSSADGLARAHSLEYNRGARNAALARPPLLSMNSLSLLVLIAFALGMLIAYRMGALRGRRETRAANPAPLSTATDSRTAQPAAIVRSVVGSRRRPIELAFTSTPWYLTIVAPAARDALPMAVLAHG